MKKTTLFLVGLAFILMCSGKAMAEEKLAYVDLGKLFSEYNKTKDYDKTLTEKENAYTAERDKKTNEVKQLQDKLAVLGEKEREAKKGDFENKVKDLQEFARQKETDLRKEQSDKMKEIFKDIETAVKQIADQGGFSMVFDDRVLVYKAKGTDLTDQVLGVLNKDQKK